MQSQYSDFDKERALQTLGSIKETILQIQEWNRYVTSSESYYSTQTGMQLLAANCTLITAIGEGINRINRVLPEYLERRYPSIPWKAIIGMRNHIAHGYFELDGDIVFDAVKNDIPPLAEAIEQAITDLSSSCQKH